MKNKKVSARDITGKQVVGKIILVYQDAVASGVNDYISVTMTSLRDKDGVIYQVRPRDIDSILKKNKKKVKPAKTKSRKLTEAEIAKGRSSNYWEMSKQEQWDEDKRLGILDWDGK